MNLEIVDDLSKKITENLLSLLANTSNDTFFVYKNFSNEVNTTYLIQYLLTNNKKVFLPKIQADTMLAIPYNHNTVMNTNTYGISEPKGKEHEINNFICIVPLLAVDIYGNRIGFGKGYYDKFLKDKQCIKIGICYDYQITDTIIPDEFDIPLDFIVSEKRTIVTNQNKKKKRE